MDEVWKNLQNIQGTEKGRKRMLVKVYITLKPSVLDPQGKTINHALASLGYDEVEEVRLGKYVVLHCKEDDPAKEQMRIEEMCQKLLANPVIEDYRYEIEEEK